MNEIIQLALSAATLLGFALKIYSKMDERNDELSDKIAALESRIRAHEVECQTRNKYIENVLQRLEHSLDARIGA